MRMILALGTALALAFPAQAQDATPRDLSGFWELRHDSKQVSPAPLTEEFRNSGAGQRRFNDIVLHASRWCHPLGTPFIMGDSAPLDLVQSKYELAIIAEVQSDARHIYLDGRGHPDPEEFDPTNNGHSIGRWEDGVLVVDTTGFNDIGNLAIPGGGLRGASSHLEERYAMSADEQVLTVTFTWSDPAMFTTPHRYTFTYYRAAPGEYAREYFCDASDPERGGTVSAPTE